MGSIYWQKPDGMQFKLQSNDSNLSTGIYAQFVAHDALLTYVDEQDKREKSQAKCLTQLKDTQNFTSFTLDFEAKPRQSRGN